MTEKELMQKIAVELELRIPQIEKTVELLDSENTVPVIVYVNDNGETVVADVDPIASMKSIDNPELGEVAETIQNKLKSIIDRV